jgi:hypothetical protein
MHEQEQNVLVLLYGLQFMRIDVMQCGSAGDMDQC